jgi:secreted trypsin-like serine protease
MMLFLLLFLAGFSAHAKELVDSPQAIIHGVRVGADEPLANSVVKVQMAGGSCTGTALSDRVVITAAHCPDLGGTVLYVEHKAGPMMDCSMAAVDKVTYVPGAVLNEKNSHIPDIALLHLETPLCSIKPAKLRAEPAAVGEVIAAAGYGIGTKTTDRPDRVALKVISPEEIKDVFADEVALNPKMAEVVRYFSEYVSQYYSFALPVIDKTSLCNGDSGGPVYQDTKEETLLIGVNGAIGGHELKGTPECKNAYLQMFTPIAPYADWINTVVKTWSAEE